MFIEIDIEIVENMICLGEELEGSESAPEVVSRCADILVASARSCDTSGNSGLAEEALIVAYRLAKGVIRHSPSLVLRVELAARDMGYSI